MKKRIGKKRKSRHARATNALQKIIFKLAAKGEKNLHMNNEVRRATQRLANAATSHRKNKRSVSWDD